MVLEKKGQVVVPATSANLGAGYDCLGIALKMYGIVNIERANKLNSADATMFANHNIRKSLNAKINEEILAGECMANEAAIAFFQKTKFSSFVFFWGMDNGVPISRGLGSSVVLRLGILEGLNIICGSPLNREEIFHLCSDQEAHPDNVGPAVFGGFVLADNVIGKKRKYVKYDISEELKIVVIIPKMNVKTTKAREVLPEKIDHQDASYNIANACLVTSAFASLNYEQMRGSFGDKLHQDYRSDYIPFLESVISAGENAGALGGYLSGSGSTIAFICFAKDAETVMRSIGSKIPKQISHETKILSPDNLGMQSILI